VAGGAVGQVNGFAGGDHLGRGGPLVDEGGIIQAGEGFLQLGGLGLLDGHNLLGDKFVGGLEHAGVIIHHPVNHEPHHCAVEVKSTSWAVLVVFLDAVEFVFAEDDLAFFFSRNVRVWVPGSWPYQCSDSVEVSLFSKGSEARRSRSDLLMRRARMVTAMKTTKKMQTR